MIDDDDSLHYFCYNSNKKIIAKVYHDIGYFINQLVETTTDLSLRLILFTTSWIYWFVCTWLTQYFSLMNINIKHNKIIE